MPEQEPDTREPRETDRAEREADAAAAEAGRIGGRSGTEGLDEAERPLAESGEGVAEGFEQAEAELAENATHGEGGANPLRDAGEVEVERDSAIHGDADHIHATGDEDSREGEDEPEG